MPRIRTLKPEAFQHRKVGRLSDRAFRLWVGMIAHADDYGRLVADPEQLRLLVFGYQLKVRAAHVAAALEEIEATGMIRRYHIAGTCYADFPSWSDHQRIDHPGKPKLPPYHAEVAQLEHPRESSRAFAEDSTGIKDQGSEGIKDQGSRIYAPAPESAPAASAPTSRIEFRIPASVSEALSRTPTVGRSAIVRDPRWWQAQLRANPGVDFAAELLKAEAWCTSNPSRTPRKRVERFLHTWFARADREG